MFTRLADLRIFSFPLLEGLSGLRHAVFTRHGGVSQEPFESLNVGFSVGDVPENVTQNRRIIAQSLNARHMLSLRQVHGDRVVSDSAGEIQEGTPPEADAMITGRPGRFLLIQVADCQAVMLFDPQNRVAANVHSGWRGSLLNIIGKTVKRMVHEFNCDPAHIRAAVSPSLGPCCAEFVNFRTEIPESFWQYRKGETHFDFWRMSRDQLIAAGLDARNITLSGLCTRCQPADFYSYRGQNMTGRFAAVIGIAQS